MVRRQWFNEELLNDVNNLCLTCRETLPLKGELWIDEKLDTL